MATVFQRFMQRRSFSLVTGLFTGLLAGCLWLASPGVAWAIDAGKPYDALTLFRLGVTAYRAGSYERALGYLRPALGQLPGNVNIRYYTAISYDQMGKPSDALPYYETVARSSADPAVVAYSAKRLREIRKPASNTSAGAAEYPSRSEAVAVVAFNKDSNALMVDATLNDAATGTFVLDTGATYTSISRQLAQELGLDLTRCDSVKITTANGQIRVPKVIIQRMRVNGIEARNVEATVIEVREGSSFSGLLGLSFIKQFKLTIDPKAGQLIFEAN